MRVFQTFQAFQSQPTRTLPVSRLTIVCLADALGALRKQMFIDLTALGLSGERSVRRVFWSDDSARCASTEARPAHA